MNRHLTTLLLASLAASSACDLDLASPEYRDSLVEGLAPELEWLAGQWIYTRGGCADRPGGAPVNSLVLGITSSGDATLTAGSVVHRHRVSSGMFERPSIMGAYMAGMLRFSPPIEFSDADTAPWQLKDLEAKGGGNALELRGTAVNSATISCEMRLSFYRS